MKKANIIKLAASVLMLAAAVFFFIALYPKSEARDGDSYFYDLQEQKLFVAPRGSIPPIKGISGAPEAGVRAIVIATNGDPTDRKHLQIAYLQKYSPDIKALLDEVRQARAEGRSEQDRIDRKEVTANTFVRRVQDTNWQPLTSEEGRKIAEDWNVPGPDGQTPLICSP